jgi:hypothetical protein
VEKGYTFRSGVNACDHCFNADLMQIDMLEDHAGDLLTSELFKTSV